MLKLLIANCPIKLKVCKTADETIKPKDITENIFWEFEA
jgi:hypothetical protein